MGKLSNYIYSTQAEFRRGKDKKKRKKRSLKDNLLGTTTAGMVARGVGALGATGLAGLMLRKGKGIKPPGTAYRKAGSVLSNPRTVVSSRPTANSSNTKLISSGSSAGMGNRVEQAESASLIADRKGIIREKRTSNTHNRRYNATLPKARKNRK